MGIVVIIWMFLVGAVIGSFVCCQAWRVRYRELGKKELGKRSVCLHCGEQLKWFDNIPILSWILLGGKCRKCGKKIGTKEIVVEIGMGVAFVLVFLSEAWKVEGWTDYVVLGLYLVMIGILGFLAIYDFSWGKLPGKQLVAAIIVGLVIGVVKITTGRAEIWSGIGGVGILAGVYYLLYILSKEKLVGGGDWMLGLALGLAVTDWWLALWVLCLANVIGCVVAVPGAIKKKKRQIYFGPYLVIAFVIVVAAQEAISGLICF